MRIENVHSLAIKSAISFSSDESSAVKLSTSRGLLSMRQIDPTGKAGLSALAEGRLILALA